jgi:hypothetical protein
MARMAPRLPRAVATRRWVTIRKGQRAPDRWAVGVFLVAFALVLGLSEWLVARVSVTGDEPWYLLQCYGLIHRHSSNLAPLLHDPATYARFLGTHADSHTRDYLGNGERVLFYLPGYAAAIAPFYALGGRSLIVAFQSLVAALTGALLFDEARRIFGSRRVAVFAWLAYLGTLPVLLYAGQLFPSTLATCAIFVGFLLVTRWLPGATQRRAIVLSTVIGLLVCALPWLHFKYALPALVLAGGALAALRPRLRWPLTSGADRQAWCAAVVVAGLTVLSFALIGLYSHHYFGRWIPPSATTGPDLRHPHPEQVPSLYADMFLTQERGLIPWVPLDLLIVPGLALWLRRQPRQARYACVLMGALLITFVSTMVTPVFQGYAFPGRFTLECAPYFAIAITALVAAGQQPLNAARVALAAAWCHSYAPGQRLRAPRSRIGWSGAGTWVRGLGALSALALLTATCWFSAVGESDPLLLYPSFAGVRLAAAHPNALPGTWFALFPHEPQSYVTHNTVVFMPTLSAGQAIHGADGSQGFLGWPQAVPAGAVLARTSPTDVPAGRYVARFTLACARAPRRTAALRLVIERSAGERTRRIVPLTQRFVTSETCAGLARPIQVAVPFASDGYHALTFAAEFTGSTPVVAWRVSYAPATGTSATL